MNEKVYKFLLLSIFLLSLGIGLHFFFRTPLIEPSPGKIMDSYRSVPVYYNNLDHTNEKRETFSYDGYYYGLKWQCVEYVKRFYYVAKQHRMPNGFGDAKDFFDPSVPQGGLNQQRGLVQYKNEGTEKPKPDDILVFTNPPYGHVAIVTKVTPDTVEVIQQNRKNSRQVFALIVKNHHYFIGTSSKPVGWLRKQ
ncbi:CHAP domain-containing protein [Desulfosporosinus sp. Sb-LF]|uniref:CHAP domain-containing protein n=1 Tax=Desulfosporosinus sp. Sb-LF TaxID=2560027 RepID=UPI00107F1A20|nr:CHAP domain-containing protein [Desulfosporosinus sp. Sb-LF]TGE31364.1 CHAP domain-containing protein [Desulfosporosinus sp. Sb-LF]